MLGCDFTAACQAHDAAYTAGSGVDRYAADLQFLNDLLAASGGNILCEAASYLYYGMVRMFGWIFYEGDEAPK